MRSAARRRWTPEENEQMRAWWEEGLRASDIAKRLRRTQAAILKHAQALSLSERCRVWTQDEEEDISSSCSALVEELAKKHNRSASSIATRLVRACFALEAHRGKKT